MVSKSTIGIGILLGAAYLWSRRNGSSNLSQVDPLKEVELQNLQLKEDNLQHILEDEPNRVTSEIAATQYRISRWTQFANSIKGRSSWDFRRAHAAEITYQGTLRDIESQQQILTNLLNERESIFEARNQTLYEIDFYNRESLDDIRQRLNSSNTV